MNEFELHVCMDPSNPFMNKFDSKACMAMGFLYFSEYFNNDGMAMEKARRNDSIHSKPSSNECVFHLFMALGFFMWDIFLFFLVRYVLMQTDIGKKISYMNQSL